MSDIAGELGISKDLVKYHRKSLPASEIWKAPDGKVWISETGKNMIKSKLRKESYEKSFEENVLASLARIEWCLDLGGHKPKFERQESPELSQELSEARQCILALEDELNHAKLSVAQIEPLKRLGEELAGRSEITTEGKIFTDLELLKKLVRFFPEKLRDDEIEI